MFPIHRLDAQPDSFDERDYPFRPRLHKAPSQFRNEDASHVPPLDQPQGKCVGYAAAGLVNLLLHGRRDSTEAESSGVSPAMLYHLARIYDEWEGEDYEGSSCRGVLKGWHHHGVCEERYWKDRKKWQPPEAGFLENSARYPMGAYYRVDHRSILDLRLALREATVALVSARIHEGWLGRLLDEEESPIYFEPAPGGREHGRRTSVQRTLGLHAFLLVGYDETGFRVQNSWGWKWGCRGLAVLTYRDWLENGIDAWVVSVGSPASEFESPRVLTRRGLLELGEAESEPRELRDSAVWSETTVRRHSAVFAKTGRPSRRLIDEEDGESEVRHNLRDLSRDGEELLVYFSGGLESEERAIRRFRQIGPLLANENKVPFFVLWRTGLLEELTQLVSPHFGDAADLAARPEARDRRFEVLARRYLRPLWTEVKADARRGRYAGGGLAVIAQELRGLVVQRPDLKLHLAAHSAGVMPLIHLLDLMEGRRSRPMCPVQSCTLLAPLCPVGMAVSAFRQALDKEVLGLGALTCVGLSEEVELVDGIGELYGPSLPILVSRALERETQTPVLCLERLWHPSPEGEPWQPRYRRHAREWRVFRAEASAKSRFLGPEDFRNSEDLDSGGNWPVSPGHQSFERDVQIFTKLATHSLV